jgi:Pyruvate/2-oxoacid:ferredoxin oxidoreductase delta subunit
MIRDIISKLRLTLAFSPQKLPILILIIVSSLALCWQIYAIIRTFNETPSVSCEVLKDQIIRSLVPLQQCDNASDCRYGVLPCPFQCIALGKKAASPELIAAIESYHKQCGYCVESCEHNSPPVCIAHQCIGDKGENE